MLLYKMRVRVKFTLKFFLKSGKVAAHFAVCSKPKSAGGRALCPVWGVGDQYPFGQWVASQSVEWA